MLYGIIAALIIVIIILGIKLNHKNTIEQIDQVKLDNFYQQQSQLQNKIDNLKDQRAELTQDINAQTDLINEYNDKIKVLQQQYNDALMKKSSDLNDFFEQLKKHRMQDLDEQIDAARAAQDAELEQRQQQLQEEYQQAAIQSQQLIAEIANKQNELRAQLDAQEQKFKGIVEPLKQYEKQQQQRLFYTIQVPDEYRSDIDFLLTTVALKVQHPEVINKLIWTEYVKPYLDDTFKRIEIKDEPGIYKLTNINDNKSYIGKSTNVKKRIQDHFKSVCGLASIADQLVHHKIFDTGLWNWSIEIITYCEKDQLSELEKYYIDFFQTQTYGWNRKEGG